MLSDTVDFSRRAQLTELMDEPCSYAELRDCLRDLTHVNRTILSYAPTLEWLGMFTHVRGKPLHIVDVGCGGGDTLRRIEHWAREKKLEVRLTGIDLNPHATRAAREFSDGKTEIEWVTGDAYAYEPETEIDLVISSLFTHHLSDVQIVRFLCWMEAVAVRGWFINDLRRGRLPYYAFRLLSQVMRWHRFVQHDGPVSVRRSFSPLDWSRYLSEAGLGSNDAAVYTRRMGRLCVSRVKRQMVTQ